jgi:predicted dehydrogenase
MIGFNFRRVPAIALAHFEGKQVKPDFRDGLMCQLVLDAAERSFKEKTWVKVKTL